MKKIGFVAAPGADRGSPRDGESRCRPTAPPNSASIYFRRSQRDAAPLAASCPATSPG